MALASSGLVRAHHDGCYDDGELESIYVNNKESVDYVSVTPSSSERLHARPAWHTNQSTEVYMKRE
jgi:hypothetical protein